MVKSKITETSKVLTSSENSFMERDIAAFLETLCPESKVVKLLYNDGCKKEEFEEYIEKYKSEENTVICVAAYASMDEFPPEKYYLGEPEEGKEPLPLEEILERDSNVLKECGFLDINNYIRYETQVAFIYPNELGKQVMDAMNKCLYEFNKLKEENK